MAFNFPKPHKILKIPKFYTDFVFACYPCLTPRLYQGVLTGKTSEFLSYCQAFFSIISQNSSLFSRNFYLWCKH
ncbi:MAG: hypothetical protein DU429_06380 [Candidatus Tokpelaia sp.]|nr:MAG: hypothetical protein DU430_01760 [Candidatus Tokpelaia sp.]KAA6206343.1 MAG: hypothetical protein DU429_06380 [Candidatus Tokpelaia sp.]